MIVKMCTSKTNQKEREKLQYTKIEEKISYIITDLTGIKNIERV